ncbi:MAG: cell wall metabolism sensor histidine kinase WalK [Oscillospiraceae bacterium]|nr:cell wall metabolism sensor histidine kinase WalK [Oscillospiraceae bacterium]
MRRNLHIKLVLIMVLLIVSLMVVVGAFLMNSVTGYYINEFYSQINDAFGEDNVDFVRDLQTATEDETDGASMVNAVLSAYEGVLGVDRRHRNFYVLDGTTGRYLAGSAPEPAGGIPVTPNISKALLGEVGDDSSVTASYMDAAIPIIRGGQPYIVYILDSRETARSLNAEMFTLIMEALALGLIISILLSFLLAKTMVNPLQRLTNGIEEVARGDFSRKLEVTSSDEIGQLTESFNAMARQLQSTIADLEREQQKSKDFVANVSHELRTPLTNIKSYAETVADGVGDLPPEMEQRFLGVILNESDRMAHILQDLLTLSRFDSGRSGLRLTAFPFARAVDDTYQAILMDAQNHSHTVELVLPENLPEVRADRERVMQVMMNIVSNAIKYTPDGGRIVLSAGQAGDKVWMEVDDNGIGIPESDRDRIFERFYRVDKARSRQSGGTGLGLSIAQEIMNQHEGRLYLVDKQEPGLTIRMELPIRGPREEARDEE